VNIEDINSNLILQLDELEILQSMFPGPKELTLDVCNIADVKKWISDQEQGRINELPSLLDFSLNISLENENTVELVVTYPVEYPRTSLPDIYARSENLLRKQQSSLNHNLQQYLEIEAIQGEPCLIAAISWLQENSDHYFVQESSEGIESFKCVPQNIKFSRFWIYSHHLYSKIKRKDILDLAPEFCLTGFSMPGKPGVICIEGLSQNCTDWWSLVRHWNWKKINVKIQEDKETDNIDGERLFQTFEEIGVVKNAGRDYHMDMGEFHKYLEKHNCTWIFKELFGIEKT